MNWRKPHLKEAYEKRLTTVEEAYKQITPGSKLYIGSGVSEPQYLVSRLKDFPVNIADTEVFQLVSINTSPHTDADFKSMFRLNTFFIGNAARKVVDSGDADYSPMFLSEIPGLIENRRIPIDVAILQVSPPDSYGNCSLGVSVECAHSVIRAAHYVIAQVNDHMPRTHGSSYVSLEDFDALVLHDEPILEILEEPPDEVAERIGFYVSRLIPNGATIQAGIGRIPNAVMHHLKDKRDLGVHTEMFSDGLIDLYESGAITGKRKNFHKGKIIASFCLGTKRLYDTIDNNPNFEFYPTDYISDPRNIATNDKLCAINSALEIDITGQVCADSIGPRFYSGIGGQADFMRGSALSKGGAPSSPSPPRQKTAPSPASSPPSPRGPAWSPPAVTYTGWLRSSASPTCTERASGSEPWPSSTSPTPSSARSSLRKPKSSSTSTRTRSCPSTTTTCPLTTTGPTPPKRT